MPGLPFYLRLLSLLSLRQGRSLQRPDPKPRRSQSLRQCSLAFRGLRRCRRRPGDYCDRGSDFVFVGLVAWLGRDWRRHFCLRFRCLRCVFGHHFCCGAVALKRRWLWCHSGFVKTGFGRASVQHRVPVPQGSCSQSRLQTKRPPEAFSCNFILLAEETRVHFFEGDPQDAHN